MRKRCKYFPGESGSARYLSGRNLKPVICLWNHAFFCPQKGDGDFCDKAEAILREALESENELRRSVASHFVLNGKAARRGWTRASTGGDLRAAAPQYHP